MAGPWLIVYMSEEEERVWRDQDTRTARGRVGVSGATSGGLEMVGRVRLLMLCLRVRVGVTQIYWEGKRCCFVDGLVD